MNNTMTTFENDMRQLTRKELEEQEGLLQEEYNNSIQGDTVAMDTTVYDELAVVSGILYQDHHVGDWVYYTDSSGRRHPAPFLIMEATDTQYKLLSADQKKIMVNHSRVSSTDHAPATSVWWNFNRYLVTAKDGIISMTTGRIMQWGEENGDRKSILKQAQLENAEHAKV